MRHNIKIMAHSKDYKTYGHDVNIVFHGVLFELTKCQVLSFLNTKQVLPDFFWNCLAKLQPSTTCNASFEITNN